MGVYNNKNFDLLEKSVESIITQAFTDWEFIICNDGSVNETLRQLDKIAAKDSRIKVLSYSQNKGLNYALNECLQCAKGEYIARQDDDDISKPERLEKEMLFLDEHAPSMGANFSPTLEQELPRLLSNFKALSLREASQVKYLQNFTNIPVENVIDPTLLLNAQEYEKFILPNLDTPYILVYCVAQNNELIRMATEYAKRNKLKTIVIKCCPTGKNHHIKGLENKNDVGIEEWLTYIKNANYVFTTSYHACIFSILFKKQFCAVYDDFGKSKIVNLLSMFHINNHADNVADAFNRIDEINYNEIDAILEYERKKSLNFLRINIEALGV